MRVRTGLSLAAALIAAGCSGASGSTSGSTGSSASTASASTSGSSGGSSAGSSTASSGGSGSGSSTGGEVIHGTEIGTHVLADGGTVDVADDLTTFPIEALVLAGDGGYVSFPASGTDAGTFSIAGVPAGATYLLHEGASYVLTQSTDLDLGYAALGRPDLQYVSQNDDPVVSVSLSGFQPIDAAQSVELGSFNTHLASFGFQNDVTILDGGFGYADGGTSLSGVVHWAFANPDAAPAYLDSSDDLYISQLGTQDGGDDGATEIEPLVAFADLSGAYVTATDSSGLTGALSTPARTYSYSTQLPRTLPGAADLTSGATFSDVTVNLSVLPGFNRFGFYADTLDLFYEISKVESAPSPLIVNTSYADPYPAAADVASIAQIDYVLPLEVDPRPGGVATASIGWSRADPIGSAPASYAPGISPVRNIKIDGSPANTDQLGVGQAPVLSWDAPSTGTPTDYSIDIWQCDYDPNSQFTYQESLATFELPGSATSIALPPGVLNGPDTAASTRFYAVVFAELNAGQDPTRAPFRIAPSYESAANATHLFAP